ncbi:MAG: flagellar motor protein MotD [Gammaproteobacteria bacterium]|nr:flagellar motor protein MotD [Gammaproteobacteria bacterium]
MARKAKHEEHENHERWLVSYADFITLLFAFFVVMYSISSVNEGKYKVLSDSMVSAFHVSPRSMEPVQVGRPAKTPVDLNIQLHAPPAMLTSPSISLGVKNPNEGSRDQQEQKKNDIYEEPATKQQQKDLALMANSIEKAMSKLIEQDLVAVKRNDFWIEVEIKSSILFYSGSSELQFAIMPVLQEIGAIIKKYPNPVKIEGFTDNKAIDNIIYPSNWELSVSRSARVARLFQDAGINPERLSASGYSQYRPVADNETEAGRASNRRVSIVVMANHDIEMLFSR